MGGIPQPANAEESSDPQNTHTSPKSRHIPGAYCTHAETDRTNRPDGDDSVNRTKGDDMKLLNILKNFRNDEDGAVTVDWVVLTAAVVGIGLVVASTVKSGLETAASTIKGDITSTADEAKED